MSPAVKMTCFFLIHIMDTVICILTVCTVLSAWFLSQLLAPFYKVKNHCSCLSEWFIKVYKGTELVFTSEIALYLTEGCIPYAEEEGVVM